VSENEFQRRVLAQLEKMNEGQVEILQRLTVVETDSKYYRESLKIISSHGEKIVEIDQRSKSAHHRISAIYFTACAIGSVIGYSINFLGSWFKGR
jgi:hypothetical protein